MNEIDRVALEDEIIAWVLALGILLFKGATLVGIVYVALKLAM